MALSVGDIVALCEDYYGPNADRRSHASALLHETVLTDVHALLQTLQGASSRYALTFASQGVVRWMRTNAAEANSDTHAAVLREVVASSKRCFDEGQPRFVTAVLMSNAARLAKLGFEKEPFPSGTLNEAIGTMASAAAPPPARVFAASLVSSVVQEMSLFESSKSSSYMTFGVHRRCSNNFRDTHLLEIFTQGLMTLRDIAATDATPSAPQAPLVSELVHVVRHCVSYDFMAIVVEESDDVMAAQFPGAWHATLTSGGGFDTLWGLLASLPPPWATEMMRTVGAVCGTRRTFFDSAAERETHLNMAIGSLASQPSCRDERMSSSEFVAAFAEASLRFITPYGYRDLHRVASFPVWLTTMHGLTRTAIAVPFGEDGSMHMATLLLQLWGRLASSKRLAISDDPLPTDLEPMALDLLAAFVESRLAAMGDLEDDAVEVMQQQCDVLPSLTLARPAEGMAAIVHRLQGALNDGLLSNPHGLVWLFHAAASLLRGVFALLDDTSTSPSTAFLSLIVGCIQHLSQSGTTAPIEAAVVAFLVSLQGTLGLSRSTSLMLVIRNVFGDRSSLYQFILQHIGHNLVRPLESMNGGGSVDVVGLLRAAVDLTMETCRELPPSVLSTITLTLPPTAELPLSRSIETYKLRTNVNVALVALRCGGLPPSREGLALLLADVQQQLHGLLTGNLSVAFVGGWLRDLRGIVRGASTHSASLGWVVEWVLDRHATLEQLSATEGLHSGIVVSLLRMMIEVVDPPSRHGKVNFPSPNHSGLGLAYFKLLCSILQHVLSTHLPRERLSELAEAGTSTETHYASMLKPLMLCMDAVRKAIQTDAVPLGAMEYYHDSTHDVTVAGLLRYLIAVPYECCRPYPKVVASAMELLRCLTEGAVLTPLAALSSQELSAVLNWSFAVVSDVETATPTLVHALTALTFFGGLIDTAKSLLEERSAAARGGEVGTPPSTHPVRPRRHFTSGGRDTHQTRLAELLIDDPSVWVRMVNVCMSVVVMQDRALSLCTQIVFPIFNADGSFWTAFVRELMEGYPAAKRDRVGRAVEELGSAAASQERFFSEIINFRNAMRHV